MDKKEVKWAPTDPAIVGRISTEIQRAALPPCPNSADLAIDYVTLSFLDMDIYPLYIMTRDTTTIQTMVMLHRSSFINHFEAFK
jgi:hypothetical protein